MDKTFIDRIYPTVCYTAGSCTAEVFATPLFTIKTVYQTTDNSMKTIVKNIYKKYGIIGFYNAVFSALFARLVSSFLKFMIYSEIKYYRRTSDNDIFNGMLNGCTAGILSSFFVHPIDVITNQLQRHQQINKSLFKFNLMYTGFSQTLIRNFFLYSVLFPVFDYSKYYTNKNIILSCLITTAISSTILQPIEYLRTRLMAGQLKGNVVNTLKDLKLCSRGWRINYLANAMHFSITMYTMEKYKNNFFI